MDPAHPSFRPAPSGEPPFGPELRIGCSGWRYASWKGVLYPASLPPAAWLRHYATVFDMVELDESFARLPPRSTFARWRRQMPSGFVMGLKVSREVTHRRRLRGAAIPVGRLVERAAGLGAQLGLLRYQLPANLPCDVDRLQAFLDALPRTFGFRPRRPLRHVIEFRHPSWHVAEVFQRLERAGASLCLHDTPGAVVEAPAIGPVVYVRFNGAQGHYGGNYPRAVLAAWADRLAAQHRAGRDVVACFGNHGGGYAVRNARTLRQLLSARGVDRRPSS